MGTISPRTEQVASTTAAQVAQAASSAASPTQAVNSNETAVVSTINHSSVAQRQSLLLFRAVAVIVHGPKG